MAGNNRNVFSANSGSQESVQGHAASEIAELFFFFFSLYCVFLVVLGLLLWNLGSRECALFFSCDPRDLAACGMSPDQGPSHASHLNKADSFFKLIFKFLLHWGFIAAHRFSCPKAHCILVPQ